MTDGREGVKYGGSPKGPEGRVYLLDLVLGTESETKENVSFLSRVADSCVEDVRLPVERAIL